jgi:hypothetical protein
MSNEAFFESIGRRMFEKLDPWQVEILELVKILGGDAVSPADKKVLASVGARPRVRRALAAFCESQYGLLSAAGEVEVTTDEAAAIHNLFTFYTSEMPSVESEEAKKHPDFEPAIAYVGATLLAAIVLDTDFFNDAMFGVINEVPVAFERTANFVFEDAVGTPYDVTGVDGLQIGLWLISAIL